MGVCCIVFDIDGMLFDFFKNFLNIEKNKKFRIFFSKFHVFFSRFKLFPTLKTKNGVQKKSGGGGGVEFFFYKNNSFSFHVLCYFQH